MSLEAAQPPITRPGVDLESLIASEIGLGRARYTFSLQDGNEGGLWKFRGILEQEQAPGAGSMREQGQAPSARGILDQEQAPSAYIVRTVRPNDVDLLLDFLLVRLSDGSRKLFAPYPYDTPRLREAVESAIIESVQGNTLSIIVISTEGTVVVAHGFLWAAREEVPELGVAVADALQGRGLGSAVVGVLVGCARALGRCGVELTTMQNNKGAFRCYRGCGFQALGLIRNPLGCDATQAMAGRGPKPTGFADEHQMVKVLDEARREALLEALQEKRRVASEMFGRPEEVTDT